MPAERSTTDRLLCADPAGAYALMDDASRQRYLDVVDEWARRSGTSAESVAEAALRAARASPDAGPARHVGHHLIGSGRRALEAGLGLRPRLGERLRRALDDRPGRFYFPAAAALTLALSACAGAALARASEPLQRPLERAAARLLAAHGCRVRKASTGFQVLDEAQHDSDHDEDRSDRVQDRQAGEVADQQEDDAEHNHGRILFKCWDGNCPN